MTDNPVQKEARGILSGNISILASLMSLGAFFLYGKWHWDLFRLRQAEMIPPQWLTWGVVDGLKLAA